MTTPERRTPDDETASEQPEHEPGDDVAVAASDPDSDLDSDSDETSELVDAADPAGAPEDAEPLATEDDGVVLTAPAPERHSASSWHRATQVVGVVLALLLAVVVAVAALVVPYLDAGPRNVPVGTVEGSAAEVEQLLESVQSGGFEVVTYENSEAMREAVLVRDVYGAITLEQDSPSVLIASGAGSVMSQYLGSIGGALGASVEDVAPGSQEDPSGYGIHVGAALAAVAGLLGAVLIGRLLPGRLKGQLLATLALAVGLGVVIGGALEYVGTTDGALLSVAAVVAAASLAVALPMLGLVAIGGLVPAGLFAAVVVVPSIGLAGVTSAPELLPAGWGAVGQVLPVGALGSLVRSVAYFSGGGILVPLLVLAAWIVAGAALLVVAAVTARRRTSAAAQAAETDDDVETVTDDDATSDDDTTDETVTDEDALPHDRPER